MRSSKTTKWWLSLQFCTVVFPYIWYLCQFCVVRLMARVCLITLWSNTTVLYLSSFSFLFGKESLFWMPATGEKGRLLPKSQLPCLNPPPTKQKIMGKSPYRWRGRGLHVETVQSALTVILKNGHADAGLTSVILIVLSIINLQFQCQFVPYLWGQCS